MSLVTSGMDLAKILQMIEEDKMHSAGQYKLYKRTSHQTVVTIASKILSAYDWGEGIEVHQLYFPEEIAKGLNDKDQIVVLRLAARPIKQIQPSEK